MNDGVDGGVLGEDLVEGSLVGDVNLVKVGTAAAEELDAVESDLGRVVEAVYDDNIVTMLEQGEGGERTDVAGTTGDTLATIHC